MCVCVCVLPVCLFVCSCVACLRVCVCVHELRNVWDKKLMVLRVADNAPLRIVSGKYILP